MRVLAWLTEVRWEACVDAAAALPGAEVTLLCAVAGDAPATAGGAVAGLLGRRHHPHLERSLEGLEAAAADALVAAARERLGRDAPALVPRGRPAAVVMDAARGFDLLVLARSGRGPGPASLGHDARFVVDHAACAVLIAP